MAHKATLPHFAAGHAHPLTTREALVLRRVLIGLLFAIGVAALIWAVPSLLGAAVALVAFDGWDTAIAYD